MKLIDVSRIMEHLDIWPYDYAIGSLAKPLSETPLCLIKEGDKFVCLVLERHKEIERVEFASEDEACRYFLINFAKYDRGLKKYLVREDILK